MENEKVKMHKNVLNYEPDLALFVPSNSPLLYYKAIASFSIRHLKTKGCVWVEINEAFGKETSDVFKDTGFKNTLVINDLNCKERFVKAWL